MTITIQVTATTPGTISDSALVTADNVTLDGDDTASASIVVMGPDPADRRAVDRAAFASLSLIRTPATIRVGP